MDYQASTGWRKIIKVSSQRKFFLLVLLIGGFFPLNLFAQAANPLSEGVTITAEVLQAPLVYPDTPPKPPGPPGPINMTDTTDTAVFRGFAYPGSVVSVLKNGTIVAESPANPDGSFEIILRNLSQGTYSFGVRAEDPERLKSKLLLFTIYVTSGVSTVVNGIFVPPTITSDKIEVKKNEPIIFTGRSIPDGEIRLSFSSPFDSETLRKTKADSTGYWTYTLDSKDLKFGDYEIKARSVTETDLSLYSDALSFRVGNTSRLRAKVSELAGFRQKCDLNADSRVNILDFSIMAFWYKRLGFPIKVDLNTDGKINLTDLSILAYCWTG